MRVGIDIGGTFTDAVLADSETGEVRVSKSLSTPGDPVRGLLRALEKVSDGIAPESLSMMVHGTTLATNVLIERRGARTGLVTTRGFRDVLEIRRLARPSEMVYDLRIPLPAPLIPRKHRFQVTERLASDGSLVQELDPDSVDTVCAAIAAAELEAVAICFLFSYLNPTHEQQVADEIRRRLPGLDVTTSADVLPQIGEYERTSTTVVNAYLMPAVRRYLEDLRGELPGTLADKLFCLQSNGGFAAPEVVARRPVNLLLSGPAGGVVTAAEVGRQLGFEQVISGDMGGTSFDVSLIADGEVPVTDERNVSGLPVRVPMADISTIGAGGGGVVWTDEAGRLRVGPRSAGADPGPACYGRGGHEMTITDANAVLGYLADGTRLGGEVEVDRAAAVKVCEEVARSLDMDAIELALGALRVADSAMADATRLISVARGYDPRQFAYVAFGGAGPLHATRLASALSIPWVLIPIAPGASSAYGLLLSDARHDHVQSIVIESTATRLDALERAITKLAEAADSDLAADGIAEGQRSLQWTADFRYVGQDWLVTVPLDADGGLGIPEWTAAIQRFHARHEELFGFSSPQQACEMVNVRVTGVGTFGRTSHTRPAPAAGGGEAPMVTRRAYFTEVGDWLETRVYNRWHLAEGMTVDGPAIIEQEDTTTLVSPGSVATVATGSLLVLGARAWSGRRG